ncbi:hypothetical protein Cgig2_029124 [Carnegiea gigantea]|uniref:DNA-directed RNA polymerase II subunit RPB9-like zinc ribbon domain-containing protein n=1 Tax=Carnegiea gigantea TaxID=171969 RepID=A0A9Q1QLX4_9CARY|nr:hypothetical protein Cgig2_029124 [Carnegiea gigantea]
MSTMKFCRECNNILYPKEDRDHKILLYACRNCDHQEVADNNCVYRNEIHHSAGERTQVLQDVAADPTLPRTKSVRCANCNHGEAVFFQSSQCRRQVPLLIILSTFLLLNRIICGTNMQATSRGEEDCNTVMMNLVCCLAIDLIINPALKISAKHRANCKGQA